ncbi:hypothetical protein [Alkalihalobacillus pseudalcaliphilus]|uniref:hypothetical protein n=1 Tax=Alkalihalobacillus pseudalcaliphilus TaxID=79884 RepID=UPI00064DAC69|nr:hypothetical protein [Alkalihalobacillus pseudalcaliphilus]KMK75191.1 hypothetical protein AB990_17300 [Alkalihalobacillus pseudalcaliphilus]
MTACQEPLTTEEVLERSQQEMSGLNSYAFDIDTLFVDGVENETKERTKGTVNVEPYEASYVYIGDFYNDEPTIHVIALDDMYYQAFLGELTEFMKVTYEHDRHHMLIIRKIINDING